MQEVTLKLSPDEIETVVLALNFLWASDTSCFDSATLQKVKEQLKIQGIDALFTIQESWANYSL